ncbi:MAG: phosphate ABC transporter permease PstA [Desulfobacteraceae bacterium]|nr:MAG: phosphate ABC transporter permease PstA [Desulfobacteraceae bacterium]
MNREVIREDTGRVYDRAPAKEYAPSKPSDIVQRGLRRRYRAERRFRRMGIAAILISLAFLAFLFISILGNGYTAVLQTHIRLKVHFDAEFFSQGEMGADYPGLVKESLYAMFPDVSGRSDKRRLVGLVSSGAAFHLRRMVLEDRALIGARRSIWVPADDDVDMLVKGHLAPQSGRLSPEQLAWIDRLKAAGDLKKKFNRAFFLAGDSREPELAGIRGAVYGSFFTLLITLLLSFPLGLATAVYLEEFAPRNRWTDLIEVNINNLAAVPSIVFGLLGLAVFLNAFGLPRSAPLVGGLVLTLMTLPVIIIASRAALQSVPPSIRDAALSIGASKMQMILHHVLPLALPGMLTGAIIGMARALGETAPLLMIGMVAFIVDIPGNLTAPATALPVQIFLWADSPERAFVERTSAATLVLLAFLILMNGMAVVLRKKFERRW